MFLGHLASLPKGQYVSLATIAKARRLPVKYLEHLARQLTQEGVVLSRQGKIGGYALAHPPSMLKLSDVLGVLEQGVQPVHCTHDGHCCERESACERKSGYQKVHSKLYDVLAQYTLADILPTITSVSKS